MRKAIVENILFGVVMLLPFLLMDYIWVKSGEQENSMWNNHAIQLALLWAVPIGFFLINKRYNSRVSERFQLIVPFLLAIAFAAIWAFIGLTIFMNFHVGIGGGI